MIARHVVGVKFGFQKAVQVNVMETTKGLSRYRCSFKKFNLSGVGGDNYGSSLALCYGVEWPVLSPL